MFSCGSSPASPVAPARYFRKYRSRDRELRTLVEAHGRHFVIAGLGGLLERHDGGANLLVVATRGYKRICFTETKAR